MNREESREAQIYSLLGVFDPVHLVVENESSKHSVPPGSETHFRVEIVSAQFEGLSRLQRQRLVYDRLNPLLKNGVHALSQTTLTPAEWERANREISGSSPPCHSRSVVEDKN